MKPWVIVVGAVGLLLLGIVTGREGVSKKTLEAVTRARVAEAQLADVRQVLARAQVERAAFKRQADSIRTARVLPTRRASVPTTDTTNCAVWVAAYRAADEAADEWEAAYHSAEAEIVTLRAADTIATRVLTQIDTVFVKIAPVIHEATVIPSVGPSFGRRLTNVLLPTVQVQYGAQALPIDGALKVRIGPSAFVGWRVQIPLAKLFR